MNNAPTRRERDSREFLEWLTGPEGVSLAAVEAQMREHFKPAQPVREYLADHAEPTRAEVERFVDSLNPFSERTRMELVERLLRPEPARSINHAQQYEPPEVDDEYDGPDGNKWSWDR